MRFVDIPVAVEARFEEKGELIPTAFTWRGRRSHISDVGRRWTEGKVRHYLIMTPSRQTFELCLDTAALRWRITKIWSESSPI